MPMVWGRHDDRVDRIVFEDIPEVFDLHGTRPIRTVHSLRGALQIGLVNIAERHDADIIPGQYALDMAVAHPTDADD